jgi:fructose/tagatose bisphosphate aldolase
MKFSQLTDFPIGLRGVVEFSAHGLKVVDAAKLRETVIDELIFSAVFATDRDVRDTARAIIWQAAQDLGAYSASIQTLYDARGKNEYKDVCVPAVNIRGLTYDSASAMFRAAKALNAGPFIFEIAKSEIGYTAQRPAEYVSCVLAAAIKEGWSGPVCIQGDHFQVKASNFLKDPIQEVNGVKELIVEALEAGFYNIDIDTSTLVDLDKTTIIEQQRLNYELGAQLTAFIREHEPEGVTVSVGGEIGEVGGKNSTAEELTAYLDGYYEILKSINPSAKGLSKVSVQTGTSHGGVPLPDGSVAQVALDFSVLKDLAVICRDKYGISGTVQHGASTLPDGAFHHFKEAQAAEVHLATGFQNLVLDHASFPKELRERMYAWLNVNAAKERKSEQTEEQFYYKTRKNAFGPYKQESWTMDASAKKAIMADLEAKFLFLFTQLGLKDSKAVSDKLLVAKPVKKNLPAKFATLLSNPDAFSSKHGMEKADANAD